jgi:tmRNA-binding protein
MGTEIKSVRLGHCSIDESFANDRDGAMYLLNSYIAEYKYAQKSNHETRRPRKFWNFQNRRKVAMGLVGTLGFEPMTR